jgi:acetyltransferase-like isoleucine patch superfamily enzyme
MNKHLEKIINKTDTVYCEEGFSVFHGHHNIFIGNHVFLVDSLINAGDNDGKIIIEDFVFFGHGVKILARGHDYNLFNELRQHTVVEKPIHIKKGSWVASGAIVLSGVTIGENAVVAAGSVVKHDVPNNAIVAGNPARIVKYIHRKLTFIEKFKLFLGIRIK